MKPHELSQALRIRQLRARRAEEDLRRARGLEAQAGAALAMARNSLQAFDDDLAQRMEAFFERASEGVDPGAVEGMRTFHSDQLSRRGAHVSAISSAAEILAEAERASALARGRWQQASNAAENLQALSVDESRRRQREMERRIEMDVDELAVGLAARRNRE